MRDHQSPQPLWAFQIVQLTREPPQACPDHGLVAIDNGLSRDALDWPDCLGLPCVRATQKVPIDIGTITLYGDLRPGLRRNRCIAMPTLEAQGDIGRNSDSA